LKTVLLVTAGLCLEDTQTLSDCFQRWARYIDYITTL